MNASTGVISGTPTAAGTFNFTATVRDASNPRQSASRSLSLTVNAGALPLSITTTSLPAATVGVAYTQPLSATGGLTPYNWRFSGELPRGMGLVAATGTVVGTPEEAGTFQVTYNVLDSSSPQQSASRSLSLTVTPPMSITTSAFPPTLVGAAYREGLSPVGGQPPYSWSVSSGNLPPGLALNPGNNPSLRVVEGTPTTAGTFNFTVTVSDASSPQQQASLALSIIVVQPTLSITTASLSTAFVGAPYSGPLEATGGQTPYTWSVSGGPSWLGMVVPTGELFGTPTQEGTFNITVNVRDASTPLESVSRSFSLTVNAGAPPLSITTTSLSAATVGVAYSQPLSATGGQTPYNWLFSGQLPSGVGLNASTGVISGTPTAAGTFQVTYNVLDSSTPQQSVSRSLSLTVNAGAPLLSITTTTVSAGTVGVAYSQPLSATGGQTPYNWLFSGQLPSGVGLNASTGTIVGTPEAAGTFNFTVWVLDASIPQQSASRAFGMSISGQPQTPASIAVAPTSASVQVACSLQLSAVVRNAQGSVISFPVQWTSSNNNVATVSSSGVVTGVLQGGPITITGAAGNFSAVSTINVTLALPGVSCQ